MWAWEAPVSHEAVAVLAIAIGLADATYVDVQPVTLIVVSATQ
jgi:hypothetical protein